MTEKKTSTLVELTEIELNQVSGGAVDRLGHSGIIRTPSGNKIRTGQANGNAPRGPIGNNP
jgi:hypothetical protein